MNKIVLQIFLLLISVSYDSIRGQDFHYSQNYNFLAHENPAHSGNLDYDHLNKRNRVLALYRNQWRSIKSPFLNKNTPFETFRFGFDGNIQSSALLKTDYIGYGFNVYKESAGDLNLVNYIIGGEFDFNKRMGERFSYLTLGVSPVFLQKNIELSNAYFDSQWNGKAFDPGLPTGEKTIVDNFRSFNLNLGLMFRQLNPFSKVANTFGVSVNNLLESRTNFIAINIPVRRRIILHGNGRINRPTGKNLYYHAHFWVQGNLKEFNSVGYKCLSGNRFLDSRFYLGIGLRVVGGLPLVGNDAVILHMIQDYKDFRFSLSYDLNFSKLRNASSFKGGLEIAVLYFFNENHQFKKIPQKFKFGKTNCPPHQKDVLFK